MKRSALIFFSFVCLLPARAHIVPPVLRIVDTGIELTVNAEGTQPFTYQWTRSKTVNGVTTVTVLPPEQGGNGPVLSLKPPYVAGWYRCKLSNSAGETVTDPIQINVTTNTAFPPLTITFRL